MVENTTKNKITLIAWKIYGEYNGIYIDMIYLTLCIRDEYRDGVTDDNLKSVFFDKSQWSLKNSLFNTYV